MTSYFFQKTPLHLIFGAFKLLRMVFVKPAPVGALFQWEIFRDDILCREAQKSGMLQIKSQEAIGGKKMGSESFIRTHAAGETRERI